MKKKTQERETNVQPRKEETKKRGTNVQKTQFSISTSTKTGGRTLNEFYMSDYRAPFIPSNRTLKVCKII